jgi:2-oxoglutarate ferredoxin oxidoreductase subunit alpha
MTIEAFNLAEKYQCPVIIASDLYLAERNETLEGLNISEISIDRGDLMTAWTGENSYRRFADTPTGISPRALPGTPGAVHTTATDEHDEDGVVISDVFTNPKVRAKMMAKRMRKIEHILKAFPEPELDGARDAELTLVGWGSTYQVLLEAMEALTKEGFTVNVLGLRYLWPFQSEAVRTLLGSTKMTMAVEANYTGQLTKLIRMETGFAIRHQLQKYDGEPFEPKHVIDQARTILTTKPKEPVVAVAVSDEGLPPDFSPIGLPPSALTGAEVQRLR